ncbi:MAG TPA: T9SS type A sorting domain-containing protein [Bacteroidia bacterium]|nr:T9SS type A sorting domain-containing protein [Bacteroidia bacterium]
MSRTINPSSMRLRPVFLFVLQIFSTSFLGAQCSVSITSSNANGMTLDVTATGTGSSHPFYVWSWGDNSNVSFNATDSHTYVANGTYTACVTYTDSLNPSACIDTACITVTVPVTGMRGENRDATALSVAPDPFDGSTLAAIDLASPAEDAEISIYDVSGRCIAVVFSGQLDAGRHTFPVSLQAPGIYFLSAQIDGITRVQKMICR